MALIGKIREKSVLLVIVIFTALMAFVLGDWQSFSSGGGDFIGLGSISGEPVDFDEYNNEAARSVNFDKQNAAQQQRPFTNKDEIAAKDRAWTQLVDKIVLGKEMSALGIEVGEDELDAYLYARDGFQPLPDLVQQGFTDSLGRFNPTMLETRLTQLASSDKPEEVQMYEDNKNYYTERRKQEKYYSLLKHGLYVTKAEAEDEYLATKEKKSISMILKRYSEIPDEDIKISDEELKAYYEEHKKEVKYFNQSGSREVKYFDVKVEPSPQDRKAFDQTMTDLKAKFAMTKNDSVFVRENSDLPIYSSTNAATFKPASAEKNANGLSYPDNLDSVFQNASIGDVVGPYQEGEDMRIAKVTGFNTQELKARHILLAADKNDSAKVAATKRKVDSLLPLINSDNFEEYVKNFSEDPGSKDKGGVYENFLDYEMVPEFSNFAKEKPFGEIGYVQTTYGFHIMEAMERKPVKYPVLAIIQKTLVPSDSTVSAKDEEVINLLFELDNAINEEADAEAKVAAFDSIVKESGYFSRPAVIQEDKPMVYGFDSRLAENKMIQLAYNKDAQVGTLCESPIKDNDRYVIGIVSKVKQKGLPTFTDIKETMRNELIKDKKAERLMAMMAKDGKTLTELAGELNTEVKTAEVTFSSAQINQVGFEPEIIGAVFSGLKDGQQSIPLQGRNGVYVVQVTATVKAPETRDYSVEKKALEQKRSGNYTSLAKAALLKKAEVIDNRRFNEIGVRN